MKCFLSGMPDLKLGLNDKIGLEKESQMKSRPVKRFFPSLLLVNCEFDYSIFGGNLLEAS